MILIPILIPLGLLIFWYERRINRENRAILQTYFDKEIANLDPHAKGEKALALFTRNGYKVVPSTDGKLVGEKKVFSIGLFFVGLFVLYVPYYIWVQKPETLGEL